MFLEKNKEINVNSCPHLQTYEGINTFCKFCGSILTKNNEVGLQLNNKKIKINPNSIYKNLISHHQTNRYYNENCYHEKNRLIIINKVFSITRQLNYSEKTAYIAINYLDCIFSKCYFEIDLFDLLILICISLSSKLNELQNNILNEKLIFENLNKRYSLKIIYNYQNIILDLLNWELNLVLPIDFFDFYFKHGIVFSQEIKEIYKSENTTLNLNEFIEYKLNQIKYMGIKLIKLALNHYEFYKYSSLAVASSCIALARKLNGLTIWNENLENLTFLKFNNFIHCFNLIEDSFIEKINLNEKNNLDLETTCDSVRGI